MAKNNEKGQKKAPKRPAQVPAAAAAAEVEEHEVVTLPQAANLKNLTDRKHSGLSPDGQVRLLDLARRTFVEETDPDLQFPQTVRKQVNDIVAIGIMCTFADDAANGDNSFAMVLQSQAYPTLTAAAESIGIKLPDIKALPSGKEEGTVMLPADKVKISKETKEQLQHAKKVREATKPELDPTKIESEEDVKKALEYMFVSGGKRLPELLTGSIDFMKKFRMHQAEQAENTDEAKARFSNYNSGDWLDEVFKYFLPPIFFVGIGRGMATVTDIEKNPIHAFIIFRDAIKDKKTGVPVLDDQEIAYCVKSIVKWFCNTNIASNQKAIDNLDKEKNKSEIEKCEAQIAKYNNTLTYITSPTSDDVDTLLDNIGSKFDAGGTLTTECQKANAMFNRVCGTYYGKQLSSVDYKNLDVNIQQYAGCILNMFRDPGAQLLNYNISNIADLEERSEEEKIEAVKAAKKESKERKDAEKEQEKKNA